eukprot:COSAG02_NODE_2008_length_10124_cov_83.805287_5_plen_301_part_00
MGKPTALGALAFMAIGGAGVQLLTQVRQGGQGPSSAHVLVLQDPNQLSTIMPVAPTAAKAQDFSQLSHTPVAAPPPVPPALFPPAPVPVRPSAMDAGASAPAEEIAAESSVHFSPADLWPRSPPQPAPWAPCYCLAEGGHPVTLRQYNALSKSQKFDDAYLRGPERPLGPRTPWVRCSHSASCLAFPELPPAKPPSLPCKAFRLRVRGSAPQAAFGVGELIVLEVYGQTTRGGECRPQGDYFQVWLSGPDELSVSATAVPADDGAFAVRLMQPGTWAAYGIWMLDGTSKSIVMCAESVRN